jgi:peptide/nickel transport system substrate-binding protein
MALAACTQTPATSSPSASATQAATRGAGDALKILYWQAPTILNSHQATGTKDYDAARLILEPLASWGPDGKPLANGLASEIPTLENNGVSKDFTTVTWKLRTGLKWSDGTAVTADDVAFTWKYMADDATAASDSDYTTGVKSVVAKDPTTAVVTYSEPNPNYYQFGVGGNNVILQKKQFESAVGAKASESPENLKPIGTGPYKLDSFKAGDVVNYVINENYRDPKKPFFKTVTLKGGGDATTAARAVFQTGDVDYAWNLQVEAPVLRSLIDTGGKGDYLGLAGPNIERVNINFANPDPSLGDKRSEPDTKHPFFNGPDGKIVRQALAMATDRASVAKELYGDGLTGKASCNQLNGNPVFESKNTATMPVCKFDVAAAGKLLEDNGWVKGSDNVRAKGGIKLKILYGTTNVSLRQKTQDILKKGWTEAGFSVELKSVPGSVFFTNTSPDGANKMFYDVTMYTNGTDPDPTTYLSSWTCKNVTAKANNWNSPNYHRYCNTAYDALVDQLRKETDAAKRNDLAIKANDILVSDVVTIPLVNRFAVASGRSKNLKGVVLTGWDSEMWQIADWTK